MKEIEMVSGAVRAGPRTAAARRGRARVIDPAEAVFNGHYDLAEFIARYGLAPMEARRILEDVGPARSALDRYMRERSIRIAN
ncbi:hypothetical protein [Ensifer sp.]|jgi:hypothetical protein|uniref:hypothetical protein n=1 Tax=Ensifer sp. TaxID=1872086 RepID=UPI002E0D597F|nr:hypothetical protein [Ensifer sp.]